LTRLEDLIGEVIQRLPHRAIAQAINGVVFIERTPTGRRVRDVSRIVGRDGETYRLETFER
jgi:Flp pilus assembly CpaF family ATPase